MIKKKGFTLFEIIISITLVSIIFSGVLGTFSSLEKNLLLKDCITIKNTIDTTAIKANLENRKYIISFYTDGDYMEVNYEFSSRLYNDSLVHLENSNIVNINVGNNSNRIIFTKNGTTGSACTIVVISENYKVDITVNVGSGNVVIKEIERIS